MTRCSNPRSRDGWISQARCTTASAPLDPRPCVIAIDAGTTGVRSRAIFPGGGDVIASYREFTQIYPEPGLVEHDAVEIWEAVKATLACPTRIASVIRMASVTSGVAMPNGP